MAVLVADSFTVIRLGSEEERLAGRLTVVLERIGTRWFITHEHISYY
jgi:ketosteroid isomerase-like protein